MFDKELGRPTGVALQNNDRFPCQATGQALTSPGTSRLQCYIQLGDPTDDPWTRIFLDNFDSVSAGTAGVKFDFPWVKNPALTTERDDVLVHINIKIADIESGYPSTLVGEHYAKYINRIRPQ
jgi:hypothetical protein